jgi:hypothetical protein
MNALRKIFVHLKIQEKNIVYNHGINAKRVIFIAALYAKENVMMDMK